MGKDILETAKGETVTVNCINSENEDGIFKQYYEQIAGKWTYSIHELAEKAGITEPKFRDKVFATVEVLWHRGMCRNNGAPECLGEVQFRLRGRAQLSDAMKGKEPWGYGHRNKDTWNDEIRNFYWKIDSSDHYLCDVCFGRALFQSWHQHDKEQRAANENWRMINQQKEENRLEQVSQIRQKLSTDKFYTSGFRELDKILCGGFKKGFLHVLAGHPEAEAYSCLLTLVSHFNDQQIKGAFLSYSAKEEEIHRQLAALNANVGYEQIDEPQKLNDYQSEQIIRLLAYDETIRVIRPPVRNMSHLEKLIDDAIARGGELFIIDCIQDLVIDPADRIYASNKEQEVTANIVRLIDIINKRNITVIARSLMNRDIIQRGLKLGARMFPLPVLSDLRDSNVIERHSYNIVFLHRPSFYGATSQGYAELHVAKSFGYRTGTRICNIAFDEETGFFLP